MKLLRRVFVFAVALGLLGALVSWWRTPVRVALTPFPESVSRNAPPENSSRVAASSAGLPPTPAALSPVLAPPDSALGQFQSWAQRYAAASPAERPALVAEGVQLAAARRPVFKALITANPREALRQAVSVVARQQLPAEVVALLEDRVEGRAQLRVYLSAPPADGSPATQPPVLRIAEFGAGLNYVAHVFGRREASIAWLPNAALNGVALDQHLAVAESPLRRLEIGEMPSAAKTAVELCPVSGKTTLATPPAAAVAEATVAVEVYGEIVYLCDGTHVTFFEEQLIQAEGATGGPQRFTGLMPARPSPSLGELRVLYIPMTFADQNQMPATEAKCYEVMRDVADFFYKSSFGRLSVQTAVTPPIKLPHNEAWYVQKDTSDGVSKEIDGLSLELQHARDEAAKLGYDANDYDAVVLRLAGGPRSGVGGYGGGTSVWVYSDSVSIVAHELGHCFGLAHANFWDTGGASAIGAGANQEYGSPFDNMGGGPFPQAQFNAQAKNQVKWLPDNFVQTVTADGVYRIHAADQSLLDPARRYALRIVKDNQRTYWGEVRAQFDSLNKWVASGLILGWKWPLNSGSNLQVIDTTPQSPGGKNDAPIVVGQTFSDLESGIHLTVLAVNTDANGARSVDVGVVFGVFPGNTAPTLALTASALNVPANAPVTFAAAAADADGDPLSYQWLSSDNASAASATLASNAPTFTRSFATEGQYVVTCVVSDGRGGRALRSALVVIGAGNARFAIAGRVTLGSQGLPGVYVSTGTGNAVPTDSSGYYTIPNLAAGTYTVAPLLYGYQFTDLFNNSVLVGPSYTGANFAAEALPAVSLTAATPVATEAGTVAGKFTLTRTGPEAEALTVSLVPAFGTATGTTDYTISPAVTSGSPYNTVTIPAGESTLDLVVTPVNDSAAEGPETMALQLGLSSLYVIAGNPAATVTILDDDTTLPVIAITSATIAARESPARTASFTVSRTGATTASLTVSLTTAGTATAGADYTALPATVTLPAGAASVLVPVVPVDDALAEDFETVLVTLAGNAAYVIAPYAASASILMEDDDQQVVSLAVTAAGATEVNLALSGAVPNPAVFVVTRTGDIAQALTIYYALAGTALHGVDYEALPGAVTFPAGAARVSIVITPRFDGLGEGPETVLLQLAAGGPGYRLGPLSNGRITINDAGDPVYVDVIATASAREPATNGRFRFTVKGMPETLSMLTLTYAVSGTATPGVDFVAPSGSLTVYSGAMALAAGQYHSLLLRSDRSLWSTGYNKYGQLGDGTTTSRSTPVLVAPSVDTMDGGDNHTLYVKTDGSLWSVGYNGNGQLGDTTTTNRTTPVQILASGVTSVSAGANFSLLVKTDGSLWGTGHNNQGQLGDGTTTQRTAPVQVLASGVRAVAAGYYHSLILKTDGSLWAAGNNFYGQLGDGTNSNRSAPVRIVASGVSAIAAGEYHSLFLKTDGSLWVVGRNDTGQLGDSTSVHRSTPVALVTGVTAIACGQKHSLFLKSDGALWAMGENNSGQLGDGTTVHRFAPIPVSSGVTAVAGGGPHTLWLRTGGILAGTGNNADGQLGLGNTASVTTPTSGTTSIVDLPIVPITDTLAEDLETITLTLAPGAGYSTWDAARSATLWLYDDGQPTVFVDAHSGNAANGIATIAENGAAGKFYLSRTGSLTAALTVNYTLGGTATNGGDYATLSGVAVIPAGVPGVDVTVTPIQDTSFEGTETLVLTLAAGAYAQSPGATLYLTDDETSTTTVAFSAPGSVVTESAGTVNIPVTLSAPASVPVTVDYTTAASGTGAAGGSTASTSVPYWFRLARVGHVFTASRSADGTTWTAFATTTTLPLGDPVLLGLVVCGNNNTLATATFDNVSLTPDSGGALVGRDVGFVNVGGSVSLAGNVYTVSGAGTAISGSADSFYYAAKSVSGDFTFTARLVSSAGSSSSRVAGIMVREDLRRTARNIIVAQSGTSTTQYLRRLNSALTAQGLGVDYRVASGVLTFAPGTTSLSIPVNVVDDLLSEPTEQIVVVLRNPNGAQLGAAAQHVIAVTDNDVAPLQPSLGFAAAASTGAEGMVPAVLVALSQPVASPVSVAYAVTGGTATAGADFSLPAGTLTFAPGELTKVLPLTLVDDGVVESSETVVLTLSLPAGATLTSLATHTLTLADNDRPVVAVAATDAAASENGDTGHWTFTRTGSTAAPLTVNFTVGGTATGDIDYTALGTSLTIPAGAATATLELTPLADALTEVAETVLLTLAPADGYIFDAPGTATITLADTNTPVVTVVASDAEASETGPNAGVFTFARTGATTSALTVVFSVTGTATSASDYTAIGTSVILPAGQSSATVTVTPIDDATTEGPEYVVVSLATNAAYALGAATFANITIADNDTPPAVVVASPAGKAVQLASGVGLLLAAVATDDGAPGPLTYAWSKFSGPGTVTFGQSAAAGTTARFSANGHYVLRISVSDGQFTVFDEVAVQVGGFAAANWIDASLGAPSTRGGSGETNGVFTVNGSGTGFNATTDSGHFVSRPVEGPSSVVARVTGIAAGASANAFAGVMMRETNFRGARRALLAIKPGGALEWHTRSAVSGANTLTAGGTVAFPVWLKIERTGDGLTAFRAADAAGAPGAWTQVGAPLTLATLAGVLNAGIAASNAAVNTVVAATFDQVALTPAPTGPALVTENLGAGALTGTVSQAGSVYTLVGSGTLGDGGVARFQQYSGDVVVTARILSRTGTGIFPPAQGGVLIRDTSLDSSAFGTMGMGTAWGGYFVWRNVIGGSSGSNYGGGNAYPYWVRLVREGDTLTAWKAVNATGNVPGPWVRQGATQIFSAGASIYVGLTADLGASPVANTVAMDSFSVVPGNLAPVVTPPPGGSFALNTVALEATVTDDGQPNPPGGVTTLWSLVDGPGPVTFGNASLVDTSVLFSGSGTYVLRLTADDGEVRVFADTTYVIAVAPPPTIAAAPQSQQTGAGGEVTLSVVAGGVGPFTYQWQKDGVAVPGGTAASLVLGAVGVGQAGSYTVVVGNSGGSVTSAAAVLAVVPAGTVAGHQVVAAGYVGSTQLTLAHTLTYAGPAAALDWQTVLPAGWSFVSETGSAAQVKPAAGATQLLTWSWTTIPTSPLAFRFVVAVPAGQSGAQSVASLVNLRLSGPALQLLAQPDPLVVVVGAARHSADADANGRLSLVELTRMIELYNARNGSVRTGAYKLDATTEDGFAPDLVRSGPAALTPYHNADTNRDALLGLIELTRIIELYNTRSSGVRTGAYHPETGTEDGFAAGP